LQQRQRFGDHDLFHHIAQPHLDVQSHRAVHFHGHAAVDSFAETWCLDRDLVASRSQ